VSSLHTKVNRFEASFRPVVGFDVPSLLRARTPDSNGIQSASFVTDLLGCSSTI
jgi:hypothetical protein